MKIETIFNFDLKTIPAICIGGSILFGILAVLGIGDNSLSIPFAVVLFIAGVVLHYAWLTQ